MSQQHAICSGPLSRSGGGFWIAPKVLCLSQNQRKSGKSGQGGLTKLWFFVTLLLSEGTQNSARTPWQVNPSSFWSHEFPSFSLLFIKKNALPWVPKTKIWIANCVLSVKKVAFPDKYYPGRRNHITHGVPCDLESQLGSDFCSTIKKKNAINEQEMTRSGLQVGEKC